MTGGHGSAAPGPEATTEADGPTTVAGRGAGKVGPAATGSTGTAPAPAGSTEPWHRFGPWLAVGVAVGFGLWALRAQTTVVPNLNDSSVHSSMIRWAEHTIRSGRVPLDGWYPYFQTGSANFHHYQSLPHILTSYLALAVGADRALVWTLYLGLALWPICIYWSARLLGWGRWVAAAAALVSPLLASFPGYGFEWGSYTWQGSGMWSMLWGMWALPLAWGFSWQAVSRRRHMVPAVVLVALTIAFHFLTAYLAFLALFVWVLVGWSGPGERHGLDRGEHPDGPIRVAGRTVPGWVRDSLGRLGRATIVGAGALLTASWVVVPLLSDAKWISANEAEAHTFWSDSYGARKILGWLVTGRIYDEGRFPIVTLLVAIGLCVCIARFRDDSRARALLGVWLFSLLLYFGRPTMGWVVNLLPGSADLKLHRYISGVHLAGIMLAGVAIVAIGRVAVALATRFVPRVPRPVLAGLGIVALLVALAPAWSQVVTNEDRGAALIDAQLTADRTDGADVNALLDAAGAMGGGRLYAGMLSGWGRTYVVSSVPVLALPSHKELDAIGFNLRTPSLMQNVETHFDETNPGDYQLFGIRFLLLPNDHPPPVPATLVERRGRHSLWTVGTTGYTQVVDTIGPITADRTDLGAQMSSFLHSGLPAKGLYPTVAFAGTPAALPTLGTSPAPAGPAGVVHTQENHLADGRFTTTVTANRKAVVLLKASYDPRWTVTVDGRPAATQMVAPAYVGVGVGPGRHTVRFTYEPYPHYPELLALGALTLLAIGLGPRLWRRFRH